MEEEIERKTMRGREIRKKKTSYVLMISRLLYNAFDLRKVCIRDRDTQRHTGRDTEMRVPQSGRGR
jgi:hypothetical protein